MSTLLGTITLYKSTADSEMARLGIPARQFNVAVVMDVSKSMYSHYKEGRVQALLEKFYGMSMALDKQQGLEVFLFGTGSTRLAPIRQDNLDGYVNREIIGVHKINQATNYAKGLECVNNAYFGSSVATLVLFVTDGDATDKIQAKAWVEQLCRSPYYFQFVGIGAEKFDFLEKLVGLEGRSVANCGFAKASDIFAMKEADLYSMVLGELPGWLGEARRRRWID